jgi:hypothetical protein
MRAREGGFVKRWEWCLDGCEWGETARRGKFSKWFTGTCKRIDVGTLSCSYTRGRNALENLLMPQKLPTFINTVTKVSMNMKTEREPD